MPEDLGNLRRGREGVEIRSDRHREDLGAEEEDEDEDEDLGSEAINCVIASCWREMKSLQV